MFLSMQFVSMMVGRMRIWSQETHVAAVTFSNYAQIRIPLNQYTSLEPLQTAILDLPYSGGRTNTTGALRLARTEVFTEANGDRPNVKNVIVLITDGYTTVEASNLSNEVQRVKDADITVFGKCSPHHCLLDCETCHPSHNPAHWLNPFLGFGFERIVVA